MAGKQYGAAAAYEKKLKRVMERFKVTEYDWNYDRHGGYVDVTYMGEKYRFEHTVAKAVEKGQKISFGSDAFAQVVLALEALARLSERGIYDFGQLSQGFKMLPAAIVIPDFFKTLGFAQIPTLEECKNQYKELIKTAHPDVGGSVEEFKKLTEAKRLAEDYFKGEQNEFS
ncbi:hypothetical protein EV210_101200 [Anaerospora hongkongensis]|uniref:J domain-containing protein n=2 Tax=Anaerospora hongkongensis TaxID=244830 RepID=A0A4R1Q229_9FIRM|nr:hypothetical protein EV210_101200 [Anaerospora hongkongensis]